MDSAFSILLLGALGVTVGALVVEALVVASRCLLEKILGRCHDEEEYELREPTGRERASAAVHVGGVMLLGPLLVVVAWAWLAGRQGLPQPGLNATAWGFALGSGIAGAALGYLDPLPITPIPGLVVSSLCGCIVACAVLLAGKT